MSKTVSKFQRRTHFNKPLIEESITFLPAAIEHSTTTAFKRYLIDHLPQSASSTRERYAEYISERFSIDGAMNVSLARAMARFGGSKAGREILCYEMLKGIPVFLDTSSIWLSHLSPEGGTRGDLIEFLKTRLTVGDIGEVASVLINAWRRLGKIRLISRVQITPIWSAPAIEAFLYVLARECPDRTMVRVDTLAGSPILRALLWPRTSIESLLRQAHQAGHVSNISELDQYHQFTLATSGAERLKWIFDGETHAASRTATGSEA